MAKTDWTQVETILAEQHAERVAMDHRSNIAAIVAHAVRESLENDRPMTLVIDMRTGLWTATYDTPRPPTPMEAGFIRRYLAGERNAS